MIPLIGRPVGSVLSDEVTLDFLRHDADAAKNEGMGYFHQVTPVDAAIDTPRRKSARSASPLPAHLLARFAMALVAAVVVLEHLAVPPPLARQFLPGALGYAPGLPPPAPASMAFRTRALGGLGEEPEVQNWTRLNGVGERMEFSHSLAGLFPVRLYDEHPEFFPLIDGRRFKPAAGSVNWNPDLGREDVAAVAAEAARRRFAAHPDEESFAVGVNDGLLFGESAETRAAIGARRWFRERPDYSNLVFSFTNRVAELVSGAVEPAGSTGENGGGGQAHGTHENGNGLSDEVMGAAPSAPAKSSGVERSPPASQLSALSPRLSSRYIGALAYYWAENAPDFPLHPNVVPFLTADRSQGFDRTFWEEERMLQRRWAAAGRNFTGGNGENGVGEKKQSGDTQPSTLNSQPSLSSGLSAPGSAIDPGLSTLNSVAPPRRLGLYDYLYGSSFLIPRIHTRLLAENLRNARRAGFTDYNAEVYANWGLDGPQPWFVAQLLLDPEGSPEVLLDEYYRRYFGEAMVPMRRFFERCERQWMTQPGPAYWLKHYRNESQARLFPSGICRELRKLIDDAARSARDRDVGRRVELVSKAFGVTERFVAMQEAREALNRDVFRGEESWQAMATALRQYIATRKEFEGYTRKVLAETPLALREFTWDDYLRHDPVPNAVAAICRTANAVGELAAASAWIALWSDAATGGGDAKNTDAVSAAMSPSRLSEADRIAALWETARAGARAAASGIDNLLKDGGLAGAMMPARRIEGLDYGISLPEGWRSYVEPTQFQRAVWRAVEDSETTLKAGGRPATAARVLRLSGNKETSVFQWVAVTNNRLHVARAWMRGHVSSGTVVSLTLGWVDAQHRRLGLTTLRLPEGEWLEWLPLHLMATPPAGSAWVGVGLRVQNQVGDDWAEMTGFELVTPDRVSD